MSTSRSNNFSISYTDYFRPQNQPQRIEPKQKNHIYTFPHLNSYYHIDKPQMNQQTRNMIERKLQIQKQAKILSKNRTKLDNFIVNYKRNPFLQVMEQRPGFQKDQYQYKPPQQITEETQQRQKYNMFRMNNYQVKDNIVIALNELKDRHFQRYTKQFGENRKDAENLSRFTRQAAKNTTFEFGKKKQVQKVVEKKKHEFNIDDIVKMQDVNFYSQNQVEINIFQFMKGNHEPFLTNEILEKNRFCHYSLIQKIAGFKIFFVREISKTARDYEKDKYKINNRLDNITSREVTIQIKYIKFDDMLSIASGRFTPDIAYQSIYEGQVRHESSQKNLQNNRNDVVYLQGTKNGKVRSDKQASQKQQAQQYLRLQNVKQQIRYQQKCDRLYEQIKDKLTKRTNLVRETVKDKKLHGRFDNQIKKQLKYFIQMDEPTCKGDRAVRQGKIYKNKNEAIKIKKLINTIVLKNNQEELINQMLYGKNKQS